MDELNHCLFMSTDWIFTGTVYAYHNTPFTAKQKKRIDLYSNTTNSENVYQARAVGQSYFVSKNPYLGTKQSCYSSFSHMIMCEDENYYLNI